MKQQWSELPIDLVHEIDIQLRVYIDKVRVRATCLSWNSFLPKMPSHKLPQLPWLLQTIVDNEGTRSHGLFNLCDKKFYQVDLPEVQGIFLKGSSHGWLAMLYLEKDTKNTICSTSNICLIDPLKGFQIQLPPRSTFPDVANYSEDRLGEEYNLVREYPAGNVIDNNNYISQNHVLVHLTAKFVTSSVPSSEDCVVVAIYGEFGRLAWCTPSHKKWTRLDINSGTGVVGPIEDVIFINNKLYAINCNGVLLEVENIGGPNPKVRVIVAREAVPYNQIGNYMFLVECSGGRLIMVVACFNADNFMKSFEAYELDSHDSCWHLVNNIGNDMLFLGYNLSFSVPAFAFPGYKGNCIYFTDNPIISNGSLRDRDAEIGIFNLEDGSIERIPGFPTVPRSLWPQPLWVTPPSYI